MFKTITNVRFGAAPRVVSISLTNGVKAVTLGLSDQITALSEGRTPSFQSVVLTPEEAMLLGAELVLKAHNVLGHNHDSAPDALQVVPHSRTLP